MRKLLNLTLLLALALTMTVFASTNALAADVACAGCADPDVFTTGSGEEGDPWIITTAEQLNHVREHLSAHFKLGGNIDLGTYLSGAGNNSGAGWEPIGTASAPFSGSFDGAGYKIGALWINRSSTGYVGLFGATGSSAVISNLTVEVAASGITGDGSTGGLVGRNSGAISNCSAVGEIDGKYGTGGLVGDNSDGVISNCYATGDVTGANNIGGLVGYNNGTISNCYATGDVTGADNIGGLVGWNVITINNCYATGGVTGTNNVGGLVGDNYGGVVNNSYATGGVTGTSNKGGLVGYNSGGSIKFGYWNNTNSVGVGTGSAPVDGEGMTLDGMKTQSFAATLNNNQATLTSADVSFPHCVWAWETGKNGSLPYHDYYKVTVYGSKVANTGAGFYLAGETVTIDMGSEIGKTCSWGIAGATLSGVSGTTKTFTMPAGNVWVSGDWYYHAFELSASSNPDAITYGDEITFTVDAGTERPSAPPVPSGSVEFRDGEGHMEIPIALRVVSGNSSASVSIKTLPAGEHSVTAYYGGNNVYSAAESNPVTVTVGQATPTIELPSTTSVTQGTKVAFKVNGVEDTEDDDFAAPSGTVRFSDDGSPIGVAVDLIDGEAVLDTSNLAVGTHTITATYSGDGNYEGVTSDEVLLKITRKSGGSGGSGSGSSQPTTQVGDTDVNYTIDNNGNVSLKPTPQQLEKLLQTIDENGTLNFTVPEIKGMTSAVLEIDLTKLTANDKLQTFVFSILGLEIQFPMGSLESMRALSTTLRFGVKLGSVIFELTDANGKKIEWYDHENPVTISMPYTAPQDISTHQIVMVKVGDGDKIADAIIPRSWYNKQRAYAKVNNPGIYDVSVKPLPEFTDTKNGWMDPAVKYMGARGIVEGTGDDLFEPQTTITRAHFVTMLMRALDVELRGGWMPAPMADVSEVPEWALTYVMQARAIGLPITDSEDRFNPNAPITRQEMFFIAYEAMDTCGMLPSAYTLNIVPFVDSDEVDTAYFDAIQCLAKLKLVNGNPNGTLNPKGESTRAEGAQFFYNVLRYDAK